MAVSPGRSCGIGDSDADTTGVAAWGAVGTSVGVPIVAEGVDAGDCAGSDSVNRCPSSYRPVPGWVVVVGFAEFGGRDWLARQGEPFVRSDGAWLTDAVLFWLVFV